MQPVWTVCLCFFVACGQAAPVARDGAEPRDGATFTDGATDIDGAAPFDAAVPGPSPMFDTSFIHRVHIQVAPEYLAQLETDRVHRVPCTLTFDDVTLANVGIRLKEGFGSRSSLDGKPGLSIKFNEFVGGQTLYGQGRLLLNNAIQDASFANEHLGYEAHRQFGLPATYTAHAAVTLNEYSYGLMVVKEPVAKNFLQRTFGAANTDGNLYEGFFHPDNFPLGDFVNFPGETELKDEVEEMRSRDDLIALAALIRETPTEQFAPTLEASFALTNYVTQYVVDSVVGHWDSYHHYINNYYLYHNPSDDRFYYIPHGMDQLNFAGAGGDLGVLAQRIHQSPALQALIDSEFARVRQTSSAWLALRDRLDALQVALHASPLAMPTFLADVARFDAEFDGKRAALTALASP